MTVRRRDPILPADLDEEVQRRGELRRGRPPRHRSRRRRRCRRRLGRSRRAARSGAEGVRVPAAVEDVGVTQADGDGVHVELVNGGIAHEARLPRQSMGVPRPCQGRRRRNRRPIRGMSGCGGRGVDSPRGPGYRTPGARVGPPTLSGASPSRPPSRRPRPRYDASSAASRGGTTSKCSTTGNTGHWPAGRLPAPRLRAVGPLAGAARPGEGGGEEVGGGEGLRRIDAGAQTAARATCADRRESAATLGFRQR